MLKEGIWGRRSPYFVLGCPLASARSFLLPFQQEFKIKRKDGNSNRMTKLQYKDNGPHCFTPANRKAVSLTVIKNEPHISTLLECSLKSRKSREPIYCQCDATFKWKPDLLYKAVIRPHGKERSGNGRGSKTPTRDKDEPIRKLAKISISHPWTFPPWTLPTFSPQQGPEKWGQLAICGLQGQNNLLLFPEEKKASVWRVPILKMIFHTFQLRL